VISSLRILGLAAVLSFLPLLTGASEPRSGQVSAASEQFEAASKVWSLLLKHRESESADFVLHDEGYCVWSRRLAEAAVQANAVSPEEAFGQHLTRMRELMEKTQGLAKVSLRSVFDVAAVQYYLAEARALVERSKGK
jgi:hypothetical protein